MAQRRVVAGVREPMAQFLLERAGGSILASNPPARSRKRRIPTRESGPIPTFTLPLTPLRCRHHCTFTPTPLHRAYTTSTSTKSKSRKTPTPTSPNTKSKSNTNTNGGTRYSLLSPSEQAEALLSLLSSPPPPLTDAERCIIHGPTILRAEREGLAAVKPKSTPKSKSKSSKPKDPRPPLASRDALWDWRLWFSSKRGGLCRGLASTKRKPRSNSTTSTLSKDKTDTPDEKPAKKTSSSSSKTLKLNSDVRIKRRKPELVEIRAEDPFHEEVQAYRDHFKPAITAEQLEDAAVLRERLATWDLKRLKDEGYCITDLTAFWMAKNMFGKPTAAFAVGPGVKLPEHRFENGTTILLSRTSPLTEAPILGTIASLTASQLRICFPERIPGLDSGTWRVDLGRPALVYDRMRAAVHAIGVDVDDILQREAAECRDERDVGEGQWKEYVLGGTGVRKELLRGFERARREAAAAAAAEAAAMDLETEMAEAELGLVAVAKGKEGGEQEKGEPGIFSVDQRIESWVRRHRVSPPVGMDGDPSLEGLNASQVRAMAAMVGRKVSLVQGPPGTGKTKTILHTLTLLKKHFAVPHPILVCTYTNVAVDNLVEGLAAAGLTPLRVGFGPSIRPSLIHHSVAYKLERHPRAPELKTLQEEEAETSEQVADLHGKIREVEKKMEAEGGGKRLGARLRNMKAGLVKLSRQLGGLKGKIYALQQEMLRDVIGQSDVICTTCITAATSSLNIVDFPVVFLDEASMSTEPASLIPLMKGCKHLALIGDHKQLPPVILSQEARDMGLAVSLFERLTREGDTPSVMLDTQYRMHPGISSFPSKEFYLGGVRDGTVDAAGQVQAGLLPPQSAFLGGGRGRPSVIFLDHAGQEAVKERSRVNHAEADIIARVVVDLLVSNPELRGEDIGIIAPYVAQISLLTRVFSADGAWAGGLRAALGDTRFMQLAQIEISTVDGFEGREKEVIVFSTVRNNGGGQIGFLGDRRRLNVGLTRARRALFVVGSLQTLGTVSVAGGGAGSWGRYARHLEDRGLVVCVD
ncbi:hypothetical protein D9611_000880 [Ephemerocybe angulata]|uniref:P-loop containing nucleoside triphosphate hydrolase protein n=1 Tax=Ephemerocybe angulata TaxID=980116 RepID=A0A8H5F7F7_9AGAR|nr:hypothetical protein D9611_000880 [Tulosesus angulatus]